MHLLTRNAQQTSVVYCPVKLEFCDMMLVLRKFQVLQVIVDESWNREASRQRMHKRGGAILKAIEADGPLYAGTT